MTYPIHKTLRVINFQQEHLFSIFTPTSYALKTNLNDKHQTSHLHSHFHPPTPWHHPLWFHSSSALAGSDAWICNVANSEGSKLSLLKTRRRSSLTTKGLRSCLAKWRSNHSCWKRGGMDVFSGLKKGLGSWCLVYISRVTRWLDDWEVREERSSEHPLDPIFYPRVPWHRHKWSKKTTWQFHLAWGQHLNWILAPSDLFVKKLREAHHLLKLRHFWSPNCWDKGWNSYLPVRFTTSRPIFGKVAKKLDTNDLEFWRNFFIVTISG